MSYVQLTSPLILFADPVLPTHAVTKRYVDNKQSAVDASWFTSGVVPVSMMPALTGDVVSVAGSGVTTLSTTGVAGGSYSKVTVSSSGRVVSGGSLAAGDIPSVSWSKITGGKPTTAGGYGITNLIALSGGSSTGAILSSATPSSALHAVTKGYVDNAVVGVVSGVLNVGDVVRKTTAVTPTGFLRCNGGLADKTTYSNLFGVIGYSLYLTVTLDYVSSGAVGAGQPWRQQYDFNTTQSGDITGWTTGTALPTARGYSQVIATKNRVYMLGGMNVNGALASVHTAVINTDGTLGTWIAGTSLPEYLYGSQAIVTKNRVYLLGGRDSNNSARSTVYTAPINTDGTLGTWVTDASIPASLASTQAIVTKNRVYLLGGMVGNTQTSAVYTAPINADGTLGAWTTGTSLPAPTYSAQAVVTKNRVYLLGGRDLNPTNIVYTAYINTDGTLGTWTTGAPLPVTMYESQSLVTKGRVYLIGNSSPAALVYSAPINADGTLGTWGAGTSLPNAGDRSNLLVTSKYVYMLGSYWTTTVQYAPISGGLNDHSYLYDGSVNKFDGTDTTGTVIIGEQIDTTTNYVMPGAGQPWRQQYDINTEQSGDITGWATGVGVLLPTSIAQSQAIITKNRVYLLGGLIGGTYSSVVYTAPINTDGTIGTWTTGTNLPASASFSSVVTTKNKVYLLGGIYNNNCTNAVYTAPINTDGTLGAWSAAGFLPTRLSNFNAFVTRNRVYVVGGNDYTASLSTVYTATINTDGTLGGWSAGVSFPIPITDYSVAITKNRVYILGGYTPGSYLSSVYTATINTDGTLGNWVIDAPLPSSVGISQCVVSKNRVYLLGGVVSGAYSPIIHTAVVNTDGTLGAWGANAGTSLPKTTSHSQVVNTGSRIYLLGGYINAAYSATVYTAPISGGLNDYSPYYDGTIQPVDTQNSINYQMPGSGQPWRQQYDINTTQSADITGWTTGAIAPHYGAAQVVVTKNKVYILGGYNGLTDGTAAVYVASINSDGTLGTWTNTGNNLPDNNFYFSQAVVTRNRVYLLGGRYSDKVASAVINSDGTLGTWSLSNNSLPVTIGASQAIITKNRVYLLGSNGNSNKVYVTSINTDGTIGAWTDSNNPLPAVLGWSQAVVTKNRVYLLGGTGVGWTNLSQIYSAAIDTDGTLGAWSYTGDLPVKLGFSQAIAFRNSVYLLGGAVEVVSNTTAVYKANINADGTLGTWAAVSSLPVAVAQTSAVVTNSRVYLLGSVTSNGGYISNATYTASISGGLNDYSPYYDGTIQPATASSFKLPDFTASETNNINYYIKY